MGAISVRGKDKHRTLTCEIEVIILWLITKNGSSKGDNYPGHRIIRVVCYCTAACCCSCTTTHSITIQYYVCASYQTKKCQVRMNDHITALVEL